MPTEKQPEASTIRDADRASEQTEGCVRTVLGDIPASSLGKTLVHEHLISSITFTWEPDDAPELAAEQLTLERLGEVRTYAAYAIRHNLYLDDVGNAIRELRPFQAAGGCSLIDCTCNGIGRDIRAIQFIARASGVHLVASCGYYTRRTHPRSLEERSEAAIAAEFVAELLEGIDGTTVRAGVIKTGVGSYPMHPVEKRVLRAAARAQHETGTAIFVHPPPGTESPFEIARVLERAGAQMDRVEISHLDERFRTDVRLFKRLGRYGCYFGFDTFGRDIYYVSRQKQHPSDAQRIEAIARVIDAGLGDRITLGHDIGLRHELVAFGGHGYSHILKNIVPRMRVRGIPQEAIDRMLVENPARLVALAGAAVTA